MKKRRKLKQVTCPVGFSWSNLKSELRAIWESNVKSWKMELAYPISLLRQFIQPLAMLLPFLLYGLVLVGGRYSEPLQRLLGTVNPVDVVTYIFTGYIVMGFIGTAVWAMGFSIRREQWFGTLESIYVTPTSRLSLVLGKALQSTIHQSISTGIEFLVIYTVFGLALNIQGILPALIIFAFMLFSLYGFGVLISALALLLKEGWILAEGLYSILMIISPVVYPLAILPNIAYQVSKIFPTGSALIGMRSFLIKGYPSQEIGTIFLHLLALDAAWILFGIIIFHLADTYMRRRGSLGKY